MKKRKMLLFLCLFCVQFVWLYVMMYDRRSFNITNSFRRPLRYRKSWYSFVTLQQPKIYKSTNFLCIIYKTFFFLWEKLLIQAYMYKRWVSQVSFREKLRFLLSTINMDVSKITFGIKIRKLVEKAINVNVFTANVKIGSL